MKVLFKVFGLEESNFLTSTILTSDGISAEEEMITVRFHIGDFETELEALQFMEKGSPFEHGFELVKTFVKK